MTRRLPLHPQPLPDEALSSWVRRLSAVYRLEPHRFIEAALGAPSPTGYLGVLDDQPPGDFLGILTERTGVPRERVRAMTLAGYGTLLMGVEATAQDHNSAALFTDYVCQFGSLAPTAPRRTTPVTDLSANWRPWVCPDLLNDHPRSCRRCLASDRVPYTRIHWRAAWMASCPVHGEMLEPFYQGAVDPAGFYRWVPARPAAPEIIALDRLTLAAVTTGTVTLPAGDRVHAGVWLRGLPTLVDEMTRPSGMLRRGAYASVARIWRDCGLAFHQGLGRLAPFEAMSPERRELVLRVTGRAACVMISGELPALKENEPALLRPSPREEAPDLRSLRPPEYRWPRLPWREAKISQARRDLYVAGSRAGALEPVGRSAEKGREGRPSRRDRGADRDQPDEDPSGWGDDKHLIPDREFESGADRSPEGRNLRDKPCRNEVLYGNHLLQVCRTCWSAICASPPPMNASRLICSATH